MTDKDNKHLDGEGLDYLIDKLDDRYAGGSLNLSDYYKKEEVDSALLNKVDKVTGKDLSTNDYTDAEKAKLASIDDGAEKNVIETIKVNGMTQTVTNKTVDITSASTYTLPTASTTELGGVKVDGSTITISDGVISSVGGGSGTGTNDYNALINKPTVSYSVEEGYKDETNLSSVGYMKAYVDSAVEDIDDALTTTQTALKSKADSAHTHTMSDITDMTVQYSSSATGALANNIASVGYVQAYVDDAEDVDLSSYATKVYVDDQISKVNNEKNCDCMRKEVSIEGTRVSTLNTMPAIPTYDGGTVLTFPNEVTLRIYTNTDDNELNEDNYVEYTGTTITIPDTKSGTLTDYIIYNLLPESSDNTVSSSSVVNSDPVTGIFTGGTEDAANGKYKADSQSIGFSLIMTDSPVYDQYDYFNWSDYKDWIYNLGYYEAASSGDYVSSLNVSTFENNTTYSDAYVKDTVALIKTWSTYADSSITSEEYRKYLVYDKFKDWLSNFNEDGTVATRDWKTRSTAELPVDPKMMLNAPIGGRDGSTTYYTSEYAKKTGSHTLYIKLNLNTTYTIESISGKRFAVKNGWKVFDGAFTDENITSWAYDDNVLVRYLYTEVSIINSFDIPDILSPDGSAVTFTSGSTGLNSESYVPIFIFCDDDSDYSDIKITAGSTSYTELSDNLAQSVYVTSNNLDSSSTASLEYKLNGMDTDDYVRYSTDKVYHIYDLDKFLIQSQIQTLIDDSLGVIENGSY